MSALRRCGMRLENRRSGGSCFRNLASRQGFKNNARCDARRRLVRRLVAWSGPTRPDRTARDWAVDGLRRGARVSVLCATAAALVILWDVAESIYWYLWATP